MKVILVQYSFTRLEATQSTSFETPGKSQAYIKVTQSRQIKGILCYILLFFYKSM